MKRRRIVVTGLGAISPVGNNVNDSWNSIKLGRPGTGKITLFDASDYPVQIAAEVKNFSLDNYDIDKKKKKKKNRQTKFLISTRKEAVQDAGDT